MVLCGILSSYSFLLCCTMFTGVWGWNQRDAFFMYCLALRSYVLVQLSDFNQHLLANRERREAIFARFFRWGLLLLVIVLFLVSSPAAIACRLGKCSSP